MLVPCSLRFPACADKPMVIKFSLLAEDAGGKQYPVLFHKGAILAYCRGAVSSKPPDIIAASQPWQSDPKDSSRWWMLLPEELITAYQMLVSGLLRWEATAKLQRQTVTAPLDFSGDTVAEILSQRGDRRYLALAFSKEADAVMVLGKRSQVLTTLSGTDIKLGEPRYQRDSKRWGQTLRKQAEEDGVVPMDTEAPKSKAAAFWASAPPADTKRSGGAGPGRSRGVSKPSGPRRG